MTGFEEVGFTLIVPAGAKPAEGWPVAVFGPGITRSKYDVFLAADRNAQEGIATLATDPVGHAFGARSEASVDLAVPPSTVRFSGFGRGRDLDRNGVITDQEGVRTPGQPNPLASIGLRDGLRQTALDNMALVRAIARGVDVDGDGSVDLRRTGVSYYAQSLGGIYGTMVMAVDPLVRAGALNVPGGPILDIARQSPDFRELVASDLSSGRPGCSTAAAKGFTESVPLFLDPPVTKPPRGAVAIQDAFASVNWLERSRQPGGVRPAPATHAAGRRRRQADPVPVRVRRPDGPEPGQRDADARGRPAGRQHLLPQRPHAHGGHEPARVPARPDAERAASRASSRCSRSSRAGGESITDPDGPAPLFEAPIADPASLERLNFTPAAGDG